MTEGPSNGGTSRLDAAFSAYADAPNEATESALLSTAPGAYGRWLRDIGDACQERPFSAWRSSPLSETRWARASWLRTGQGGPPRFGQPLEEPAKVALAAFVARPRKETRDAVCRVVAGDARQWYADFCAACGELPGSAWSRVLNPVPSASVSAVGERRSHRRHPTLGGVRVTVPSLAAAMVALAVSLVLVFGGSTVPPPAELHRSSVVWRLAGFIGDATWEADGGSGTSTATAACSTGLVCYADEAATEGGGTVVMRTEDGGATWQGLPLPAGWKTTTSVACLDDERCLVGASRRTDPAHGPGNEAAVLVTSDGGARWIVRPVTSGVAALVDVTCGSPAHCVGLGYGPTAATGSMGTSVAVVSADGGNSWAKVALPGPFFVNGAGLSCPTAEICVAVGTPSLVMSAGNPMPAARYSSDGGRTWQVGSVPAAPVPLRAVSCAVADRCVAVGDLPVPVGGGSTPSAPTEAFVSEDGGRSWSVAGQIGNGQLALASISCPSSESCWAAGSASGRPLGVIESTHDGGTTWTSLPLPPARGSAPADGGPVPLNIQDVSSVSCPAAGPCTAFGSQGPAVGQDEQLVLRGGGV